MITNRDAARWVRACADVEHDQYPIEEGTPGAIIAEFSDPRDAMLFRGMKGPNTHTVTAGIYHRFAVRRLVRD